MLEPVERVTLAMVRREAVRVFGRGARFHTFRWSDSGLWRGAAHAGTKDLMLVSTCGHTTAEALRALYAALRTMPGRKT